MNTITINEFVGDKGIFLDPELLSEFKNNRVQITIQQLEENKTNKNIMKFAGILSENDTADLLKSVEECRSIDMRNW